MHFQTNPSPGAHGPSRQQERSLSVSGDSPRTAQEWLELLSHFKVAARQSGLAVWMLDLQNRRILQDYNSQAIYGGTQVIEQVPESIIASGLIHPEDCDKLSAMYERLYAGEAVDSYTIRWKLHSSGSYRWRKINYTLLYSHDGIPLHAIGSSIDVTDQTLTEQRYNDELMRRTVLEAPCLGYLQFNLTRDELIVCNFLQDQGLHCPAGISSAQMLETLSVIFDESDAADFRQAFSLETLRQDYLARRRSFSRDYLIRITPNRTRWISLQLNMIEQPGTGDVIAFIYGNDIDDQKLQQLVLQRVIVEEADFLGVIDTQSGICRCIKKGEAALQRPQAVAYADVCEDYLARAVHPDEQVRCRQELQLAHVLQQLEHNPSYQIMHLSGGPEASQKMFRTRFFHLDRTRHLLVQVRRDITDIYRSERAQQTALQHALDDSRRANAAKSEFLSRMSHDIRTPMNAILGMTHLALQEADDPAAVRESLGKIIASGNYLLGLIGDILDMSKIENTKMQLRREPLVPRRFFTDIFNLIEPILEKRRLQFRCHPALDALPAYRVLADPLRLQQVMMNLLSNAVKFTPEGGQITLTLEELARQGGLVTLRICLRDTGVGMRAEFLPRLFLPFEQETPQRPTAYPGTGLGMAIVKNLVDLMGGTISVDSAPGAGTAFTLVLAFPLAPETDDTDPPGDAEQALPVSLSGRRVLLAEDHPINAEIACKLLQQQGMQVDHVENGLLALEAFRASPSGTYDAILMDIRMPEMDGLEATRAIRALDRPDAAAIPILAMTANAFAEDLEKSAGTGMTAHLSKPIMPVLLYHTLSEAIAQREGLQ